MQWQLRYTWKLLRNFLLNAFHSTLFTQYRLINYGVFAANFINSMFAVVVVGLQQYAQ